MTKKVKSCDLLGSAPSPEGLIRGLSLDIKAPASKTERISLLRASLMNAASYLCPDLAWDKGKKHPVPRLCEAGCPQERFPTAYLHIYVGMCI